MDDWNPDLILGGSKSIDTLALSGLSQAPIQFARPRRMERRRYRFHADDAAKSSDSRSDVTHIEDRQVTG